MIRPYTPSDLPAVAALWHSAGECPALPPALSRQAQPDVHRQLSGARVLVCQREGQGIVGFVALRPEGELSALLVAAPSRRQGVGCLLLDVSKALAPALAVRLPVHNTTALSFFRREGFSPVATGWDPATGAAIAVLVWPRRAAALWRS